MGGFWIKMRKELPHTPEVFHIAAATGLDVPAVIGRLFLIWAWADSHCDSNGRVTLASRAVTDGVSQHAGFSAAMEGVRWLAVTQDGVTFPSFEKHMGEGSKARAQNAERQRRHRETKREGAPKLAARSPSPPHNAHVTQPSRDSVTRKEKTRRDKESTDSSCPDAGRAGSGLAASGPTPSTALATTKKPRARNPLYDAVAEVTGTDPATAGSLVGKVTAALAGASPPYTEDDVRAFGRQFRLLCPWAANERDRPTPNELQTHIGKLRAGPATVLPGRPKPAPTAFDRGAATEARVWGQIAEAIPELFQ
jgi:hypothetical protein